MEGKLFHNVALVLTGEEDLEKFIFKSAAIFKQLGKNLFVLIPYEVSKTLVDQVNRLIQDTELNGQDIKYTTFPKDKAVEVIIKECREKKVDLTILELGDRENELERYYEKSISRQLVKIIDCSLLLLRKSDLNNLRYFKLAVVDFDHPKAKDTSRLVKKLNRIFASNEIISIEKMTSKDHIALKANGYSIYDKVKTSASNLLVMSSPDTKFGYAHRVLTDEVEYIISEPPSDLLFAHSTKGNSFMKLNLSFVEQN